MRNVVEAGGLVKRFGEFTAVNEVEFEVHEGEVFGFLGPNGAGKSSTMRMIATVSPITEGALRVLGMDATTDGPQIRARIGVVPQEDSLDQELTVEENLMIYGRYFDLPRREVRSRLEELLEFARLEDRRGSKVASLSGGMKRRLTMARGLINRPDLLLLDEPTTGLDPQARHLLWDRLYRLKQDGVTQILTTHYMDEAEQLCDRLVIMDQGRIVALGTPRSLIAEHTKGEVLELRPTPGVSGEALGEKIAPHVDEYETLPERVLVPTSDADGTLHRLTENGIEIAGSYTRRATLEDVFLHLTGRALIE